MKKLFVIAALATVAATGASAMADSRVDIRTIEAYAGGADTSNLTDKDVITLLQVIHGGDTEGEKRAKVKNYLR
jgi:hypothetical protein